MKLLTTIALLAASVAAQASDGPVGQCRTAHAGNAAAHIACLEDALRARGASSPFSDGTPIPAVAAVPAVATSPAATAAGPLGLGAEQAKARQQPLNAARESAEVRIISTGYNAAGLGTFGTADGQVWRETTRTPTRLHLDPQREYPARIEKSSVGGYRLYVEGVRWMHKVERLQ